MGFVLTEDQELIRRSARSFVQGRLPISHLRTLRDRQDRLGYSREIWKDLAAAGLVGVALPERYGGGGLGHAELGLVLEEVGRTLAPTPFLSTILLSANAILTGGSEAQKEEWLPAIASGERIVAFAHDEGTRFEPHRITASATATPGGFRLSGEKTFVLDGDGADALIVVARAAAGLTLFLVPAESRGITVSRLSTIDSRNVTRIRLDDVEIPAAALLGHPGDGERILGPALDSATAGLAAEMLGSAQEAFEKTIGYLKTRKQFGVPIGSFQALKHRAAQMFCEIELSKSIVLDALRALDANRSDAAITVSTAKARLNDTFVLVASEAVQMHGGIGVTDELDIGFYFKRARAAEMTLGTSAWHRERFARLSGY
jgi:alkylation response protein AidB-like acyl-CoA dehydrogenase